MKKDKNTESKQAIYRGVNCPTCHSKAGDHCRSMGLRGKAAGNIMPTSCHDARIIASGNTPRSVERSELRAKTVKARGAKRHQAGKRSWVTRRAHQQPVVMPKVPDTLTRALLIEKVLQTLEDSDGAIKSMTLTVDGLGSVTGTPETANSYQFLVVKA